MSENDRISDSKLAYLIYEGSLVRSDRSNRRLWVLCIILTILLVVTNGAWIYYESQFEMVETTSIKAEQETDGGGDNIIVGGDYGETKSDDNKN